MNQLVNLDGITNCTVCDKYIDFAGSKYCNGEDEVLCLSCVAIVRVTLEDLEN